MRCPNQRAAGWHLCYSQPILSILGQQVGLVHAPRAAVRARVRVVARERYERVRDDECERDPNFFADGLSYFAQLFFFQVRHAHGSNSLNTCRKSFSFELCVVDACAPGSRYGARRV